jgi:hypothetical protein
MAEENSETEQTTDNKEAVEKPAATVKKKAVKKKTAKKKAASKKKATSKKKTAIKKKTEAPVATPASATGDEDKPAPAPAPQPSAAEPAAETTVMAAAASMDEGAEERSASTTATDIHAPGRSETVIKAEFIKEEPPEDRSMASESKSAGGFWVKAIFWLVIVVLAFIFIRSLAKRPGEEPTARTDEEIQEVVTTAPPPAAGKDDAGVVSQRVEAEDAATSEQEIPVSEVAGEHPPRLGQEAEADLATSAVQRDEAGDVAQQPLVTETTPALPTEAAATEEVPALDASVAETPDPETPGPASADTATIPPAAGLPTGVQTEQQRLRDVHDESVARILKEFDELREAARVEMDAMRNLIQAERELRDAMAPRPPSAYPPAWRAPEAGYGPYAPAPRYYPRY